MSRAEAPGAAFPALDTLGRNGTLPAYGHLSARDDHVRHNSSFGRRLRRVSREVRDNTPGRLLVDINSSAGFDAPVPSYHWPLLGRRTRPEAVDARDDPSPWCGGAGNFAPHDLREARMCGQ